MSSQDIKQKAREMFDEKFRHQPCNGDNTITDSPYTWDEIIQFIDSIIDLAIEARSEETGANLS